MKKLYRQLFFLIILSFNQNLNSQILVRGSLHIGETIEACMYAKIQVTKSDSSKILNLVTDTLGGFQFEINNVDTIVQYFLFIDHPEIKDTIIMLNLYPNLDVLDMGIIKLTSITNIDEVVISSKTPIIEKKIDRLVFNIENTSNEFGKNALNLLSKTPLVFVQNRGIAVIGKAGVMIMINERLIYLTGDDLIQYLESIPSEEVMKIEVITNPPSRYDASGSALINIVLKKNRLLGLNGRINGSYTQAFYDYERLSFSLNYRKKKLNLYGIVSGRSGKNRFVENTTYDFVNTVNNQEDISIKKNIGIRGNIGMDYFFSDKTTLSVSAESNFSNSTTKTESLTNFYTMGVLDSLSQVNRTYNSKFSLYAINTNFQSELDSTGKTITINANYISNFSNLTNNYSGTNKINDVSSSNYILNSGSKQLIQLGVFSIDYKLPTKIGEITFGGKFNWIGNKNNNSLDRNLNGVSEQDLFQNDQFIYNEFTEAVFIMYNKEWEKDEIQFGLRAEYTQLMGTQSSTSNTLRRDFFALFPTAYYLHQFSDKHYFSLSVGRRIDRPGYSSLNPFRNYLTIFSYDVGNPTLRPTYLTDVQMDFVIDNSYTIGLLYTNFHNSYMEVPINNFNNEIAYTQNNVGNTNQYGAYVSIPFNITKNIENSIFLVYLYSKFNPKISDFKPSESNIVFVNFNSSFKIYKNLSGDLSVVARPLGSIYTLSEMDAQYIVGFGLSQKLLKGQLILSCSVSDIFRLVTPQSKTRSDYFTFFYNNYYDSADITFSLSYRFGNRYLRNNRDRETGAESERGRL